jgi:uncharacterized membrane protein HdeD (DUF308 family)
MMVQVETKSTGRAKPATMTKSEGLPFTKLNYYVFAAGLLAIVLGYFTLSQGSITLAPILLVVGYCVIIPVAILYRGKESSPSTEAKPSA